MDRVEFPRIRFHPVAVLLLAVAITLPNVVRGQSNPFDTSLRDDPAGETQRRLTAADVDPRVVQSISHERPGLRDDDQAALQEFRQHVHSVPYPDQKRAAWEFLKIRTRKQAIESPSLVAEGRPFDLHRDMAVVPDRYCGHPVVLAGRITNIARDESSTGNTAFRQAAWRATLSDPNDRTPLAVIDFPADALPGANQANAEMPAIVVGFVFKLTAKYADGQTLTVPLLVARGIEWLHVTVDPGRLDDVQLQPEGRPRSEESGVRPDEAHVWYEVLKQAQLIDDRLQRDAAAAHLKSRIENYLIEAAAVGRQMDAQAESYREKSPDDTGRYNDLKSGARLFMRQKRAKYEEFVRHPDRFPSFPDVFRHPADYQGIPVTFTGHVRKVMSYAPDEDPLRIGTVHELWMFTDDSQQNPAVVVCTELPPDFPVRETVIDNVTVTGYLFKMYRYSADDADRIAPMLLAHRVTWQPIDNSAMGIPEWLSRFGTIAAVVVFVLLFLFIWQNHLSDQELRRRIAARAPKTLGINHCDMPVPDDD